MSIDLTVYWMGRDELYPLAMTLDTRQRARRLVGLVNDLIERMQAGGVHLQINPKTGTVVSSGWRPPAVNAATPNAATNSKHMTGDAIDLYDPDGDIDNWLMSPDGVAAMEHIGLWMEHPSATKGWAHVQSLPPRSGNRVFYP